MRRTGVRSWMLVVAGSLIVGGTISACGGGSSDPTASNIPQHFGSAGRFDDSVSSASTASTANSLAQASSSPGSTIPSAPGTVTLSWAPPTEYTDGTAMANLAGYHIHYGTRSQNYTSTIQIANPGIATYVVQGLSPGTYYFAVSAYDSMGAESDDAPEVSVAVN